MIRMASMSQIGVPDAARILGRSRATVKRQAAAGLIPSTKLPGPLGAYVFERATVEALANSAATC